MNFNNLISVIIPSCNRKEYLGKAIESVLNQTYKKIEIIIIDDASMDNTEKYIEKKYGNYSNIKYYKNQKNMGAGASRKRGYINASGNYIIFMDDDDYYTDFCFFENAIKIFETVQNTSFVSSSSIIEYVNENRKEPSIMNIEGKINNIQYLSSFQQKYMKSNSTFTTIFSKKCLENANIKEVEMLNDSTIYLRALLAGDAYILKTISGVYRVHSKNISTNLSVEFIIKNLEEKNKVYQEIKKRKLLKLPEEWLKGQIILTISFWIKLNKTKNEEIEELIGWCNSNLPKVKKDVIDFIRRTVND